MAVRVPLAMMLAAVITFGLFWTMQALVSVGYDLKDAKPSPRVEFVRLKRDSTPQTKKREPPKRQKPEQAPPPPDISVSKASLQPTTDFAAVTPDIDASAALDGGLAAGAGSDRDAVPLVRIEPEYPMRARQRGIEGWVHVQFTISRSGTVIDPVVAGAQPPGVFEEAAITAVSRWKYNPKIVNGIPVERPGQQIVFPFEMEN
ncbi:MAG: TonB family protein [Myxococcota bacterium]|jgi:protein TonB|nr:TonB family protein [Myxococcota bacterium]